MAHEVALVHDGGLEITVSFPFPAHSADHQLLVTLRMHTRRLIEAIGDLKELILSETAPGIFDYRIETTGGREVTGVMDFSDPTNPTLTVVSTGPGWPVTDLHPFRGFRDAWMAVRVELGANGFSVEVF